MLTVLASINQLWSMDFMRDQLSDGRCIRLFNVIDDFSQEALGRSDMALDEFTRKQRLVMTA